MSHLNDLYQEVILDHNREPRNFKVLGTANCKAEGYNPLCGDHITVYLKMEGDRVKDISFQGSGCAISKASGSLMTQSVKGRTKEEAESLFEKVHRMATGKSSPEGEEVGKLAVFSGVSQFPARVKCATLAWHTLLAAFDGKENIVETEGEEEEFHGTDGNKYQPDPFRISGD